MLDPALSHWLDTNAQDLDSGFSDPQQVLSELAAANVLRVGISPYLGGVGRNLADAVESAMWNVHRLGSTIISRG